MPRVAILFDNFGPYHLARLRAASGVCDLLAVEFGASSSEYDWEASESEGFKRVVVNQSGSSRALTPREFQKQLHKVLNNFHPEVVIVPGWGFRGSLLALQWCVTHGIPAIVMSESTAWDDSRAVFKEWVKRRIISLFSAALVGGTPHRAYMQVLGMPADRIFVGYDAVDNRFFSEEAREMGDGGSWKIKEGGIRYWESEVGIEESTKEPYFLASARFIEKKNLPRLLRAYALYREMAKPSAIDPRLSIVPWPLILLGDGPLRPDLCHLIVDLGLQDYVQMPGFKQYGELPEYYADAGAFVHASTTEQWGLVVNEAMASGLPVLVSNSCGCAADLVKEGENGWAFDPLDVEELARLMVKISSSEEGRSAMGRRSREIIAEWGPDRFAKGVVDAVNAAVEHPVKSRSPISRILLKMLLLK